MSSKRSKRFIHSNLNGVFERLHFSCSGFDNLKFSLIGEGKKYELKDSVYIGAVYKLEY